MPRVTRQSIENLKARVNIYDVASPVVSLKRSGRNWVGLSPFSHEKTPSFYVLPDKNIFKCFSTGLAGDPIRFLEETEKLPFQEAVEALAERFNITLEYEDGAGPDRQTRSLKRELLDIHDYATDFFHRALFAEHPDSAAVRDYWETKRRFSLDLAKEFKIGFAPVSSQKLNELLVKKGFSTDALRQCGLFYNRDNEPDPRTWKNRFRGRLMVPIRDYQGEVIAFTARKLDLTPADDPAREAKYINSPETPVFHKSRVLFNLDRARGAVDEAGGFLMVEGQLDALRCWASGFPATVAPQGTSVTEEQLRLLRRYHGRLDVLLDGDSAGQKAALRVLPLAFKAGLEVRFLTLPEGQDPDSLLASEGRAGLEAIRSRAEEAITHACRRLLPDPAQASPQARTNALHQLFPILREAESATAQAEYLRAACACMGLDAEAALRDFSRQGPPRSPKNPEAAVQKKLTAAESVLLWIVLRDGTWGPVVATLTDHDWIDTSSVEGALLARVLAEYHEDPGAFPPPLDHLHENQLERDALYALYAEDAAFAEVGSAARECIERLARRYFRQRMRELDQQLSVYTTGEAFRTALGARQGLKERELRLRADLRQRFDAVVPASPSA